MTASFLIYDMNRKNRQGLEEEKFSKDDWHNLLSISHRYECERARERSIKEIGKLDPPIDDVDKISMANNLGIEEWLLPACVALVERQAPLTHVEAMKLGLNMTVLVSEAREKYIQQQQGGTYNSHGSWGQQQSRKPKTWADLTNGASNSWGKQPNKDATQVVKEVLHIK